VLVERWTLNGAVGEDICSYMCCSLKIQYKSVSSY